MLLPDPDVLQMLLDMTKYSIKLNSTISDCISSHDARDEYIRDLERRLK